MPGGLFMCPYCADKRSSYCIWCRFQDYATDSRRHTRSEQEILEQYRSIILQGIEAATKYDQLELLETFEQIKEACSIELLQKWKKEILEHHPNEGRLFQRAKRCAFRRKSSWYTVLIRQKEGIQSWPDKYLFEHDEEGNVRGFALRTFGWTPPINPPDLYRTDPEQILENWEHYREIKKLPQKVGALPRKWASAYQRILEIQLAGEDVSNKHLGILGLKSTKQPRELKSQAFESAGKCMAKLFPELEEKQALFKIQRGKKWRSMKSTFKQRTALHKAPGSEGFQPRLVKHRIVIRSGKLCHSKMDQTAAHVSCFPKPPT
jgi:hypothetical protein